MTADDVKTLTRRLYEREREDFDLQGMIDRAKHACPKPELASILMVVLESVGHEIFEAGFYAGTNAGLEVSEEIRRAARNGVL